MFRRALLSMTVLLVGVRFVFADDSSPVPVIAEGTTLVLSTDSRGLGKTPADDESEAPPRLLVEADYLLWWTKGNPVPGPLVTSGSSLDPRPGAVGMPGTAILLGDEDLDYKGHSGLRLTAVLWIDKEGKLGIEASGFVLETHTIHFEANSDRDGSQVIARPFLDAQSGLPHAQVITAPGARLGGIDLFSDSRLWGAEANAFVQVYRAHAFRADLLAGGRFLGLREDIRISQSSTLFGTSTSGFFGDVVPAPAIISLTDRLKTHNEFYGGQVGVRGTFRSERWLALCSGKIDLGSTYQVIDLKGLTQRTGPDGETITGPGGLLALASNSGFRSRHRLAAVAEFDGRLGYQLTPFFIPSVGYTFLYWSEVARPGDQIDLRLDPRQIPTSSAFAATSGAVLPSRLFGTSDFWAQGLNLTLEFRY